jgi:hypothetical protein
MPVTYTARRRLLMQAVMIAILAATLGLAAMVRNARTYAPPTPLGPHVPIGLFEVALPAEWNVTRTWRSGGLLSPMVQATDKSGRVLRISQLLVDYDATGEDILRTFYNRKLDDGPEGRLTIAGGEALTLSVALERRGEGGVSLTFHQFAILIVDRRVALAVELEAPGETMTLADRRLFRDVAAAIRRRAPGQASEPEPASTAPSTRSVPADD